jgi:hypothetical protein
MSTVCCGVFNKFLISAGSLKFQWLINKCLHCIHILAKKTMCTRNQQKLTFTAYTIFQSGIEIHHKDLQQVITTHCAWQRGRGYMRDIVYFLIAVFWVMMMCNHIGGYKHFGGAFASVFRVYVICKQ